jgi:phosphoglycerate dehydrogenase-like enzyme
MVKLLVLDPIHNDGLALLRTRDDIDLVHLDTPTDAQIARHMPDADVLLLRGRHLAREHWTSAQKLRMVTRHGVGCDNIDFDLMAQKGITVAVTADANYVSVAEHACTLMLAGSRNLIVGDHAVRSGQWTLREDLGAREIQGAALLVVGFGRIGQAFAARATGFGVSLLIYDPFLAPDAPLPHGAVRVPDLPSALSHADIISLHLPRTDHTADLFDATMLANCRRGALLINTGRGGIVEETALLQALENGTIRCYATDVLANEPPARNDPLLARDDVIVTPHSAAMTQQGAVRMATRSAQNALDFIDGTLASEMMAFRPSVAAQ